MAEKAPPSLKAVQPFLMVAKQFARRDPVVAYYANMFAVQEGIANSKSDPAAKAYLMGIMDQLQEMRRGLREEEALSSDVVAQAHIEDVALKLFEFADNEDRAARFHKNMIKAFFTASQIFTTLRQFGELSEEVEAKMKYAKWKAVEIDRCLKNGITPTPGPPGGEEFLPLDPSEPPMEPFKPIPKPRQHVPPEPSGFPPPQPASHYPPQPLPEASPYPPPPQPASHYPPPPQPASHYPPQPLPEASHYPPPPQPTSHYPPQPLPEASHYPPPPAGGVQLGPNEIARAQKLCKFASSALEYEDVQGAVEYLSQAMTLLRTGKDSGH